MFSETDLILNDDGSVYHLNLLPKHISDTIITVGDPGRVNQVAEFFDSIEYEVNKREFVTITGYYKKKRISVISTGIGPDNIEIFFNEIDALANIDLKTREAKGRKKRLKIIRIGTSGAVQTDIALGSFLVSQYAVGMDNVLGYYELPQTPFENTISQALFDQIQMPQRPYVVFGSEKLNEAFNEGFIKGNTLTAPGFYAPQGRSLRANSKYPKLLDDLMYFHSNDFWISNIEMETAAYYAFARIFGHHAISVNAILANRARNRFAKQPTKVVNSLIKKVLEMVYEADL